MNVDRTLDKYTVRLVTKGFLQIKGVNFFETLSPIVKPTTIKVILTLTLSKGWKLSNVNVNNDFLNKDLIEDVFMLQSFNFEQQYGLVCKLKKRLSITWNKLTNYGFLS